MCDLRRLATADEASEGAPRGDLRAGQDRLLDRQRADVRFADRAGTGSDGDARPGGASGVAIPTIVADPARDALYAAFVTRQNDAPYSTVVVRASRDRGRTWSKPVRVTPVRRGSLLLPAAARRRCCRPGRRLGIRARAPSCQRRPGELRGPPARLLGAAPGGRSVQPGARGVSREAPSTEPGGSATIGARGQLARHVPSVLERHAHRLAAAVHRYCHTTLTEASNFGWSDRTDEGERTSAADHVGCRLLVGCGTRGSAAHPFHVNYGVRP